MEAILVGLTVGLFLFLIVGVLGLIKPSLVKQKTRSKAFLVNIIPAFVVFVVIGVLAPDNPPAGIDYEITMDEAKRDIKRTVEVVLPERVDETTLKALAETIHKAGFERTFIGYRLKGEEDGVYWATTNYNPNLKISILGSEKAAHNSLKSSELQVDGELIGKWLVNWGYEYKAAIYKKDDQVMMKTLFSDGSGQDAELSTHEINGQIRYYDDGGKERGEYYIVSSNGDLQFWSENGNYYSAPNIE